MENGATRVDYKKNGDIAAELKPNSQCHGFLASPHLELSINSERYQRKLVLHFDIRNTILVADSVTNINVEQALNSYLTGVTWGREGPGGSWEWASDIPSPYAPAPELMTYYKHMEKQLVKEPQDRAHLRRVTGDFTQEPLGERFNPYFKKVLEKLKWPHVTVPDPQLTMAGQDGTLYYYILPSFFQLLEHLHATGRDFSIIIRTYGMDAPNVLRCIDYSLRGNHPRFKNKTLPYPVNLDQGHILRTNNNITLQHTDKGHVHSLTSEQDIYRFMSKSTGIQAFVDDFIYWQDNQYHFKTAKPHWIDPTDKAIQHIFFDDNLRVTDDDSIVNVRIFPKGVDHSTAVSLNKTDAAKYENMCLVLADLLDSTEDLKYFIKKIETCEEKYDEYLESL